MLENQMVPLPPVWKKLVGQFTELADNSVI